VIVAENQQKKAVALRYDPARDSAPKVVAKGQGALAERILALAKKNGVPVREDRALVGVLSRMKVDQEIPPQLYQAIATILAFLLKANNKPG